MAAPRLILAKNYAFCVLMRVLIGLWPEMAVKPGFTK